MSILLIATGGTIASKVQPDGGVARALDGSQLLDTVDGLDRDDVDIVDLFHGPSWNLDLVAVADVASTARDALTSGRADGVVVTHGTDTLEETAFLCDLLAGPATASGPIVVTGSMRNAGEANGDGPQNLRDAFAVARSSDAAGRGALVCLHGEVHAARHVTKTDTQQVDTFRSPATGPIGTVAAGEVRLEPSTPRPEPPLGDGVEHEVAIIRSYGGIAGDIVRWHLERGARGLVVEGSGAGNVSGDLAEGIEWAIADGVPVVVVSRCLTGSVAPIYGGPGGNHTLAGLGVVNGGDLDAGKARVALAVALGADPSIDAVRAWFEALLR